MSGKDTGPEAAERGQREYPHGSGDRNTTSPLTPDKQKEFHGGTQRRGDPDAGDGEGEEKGN